MEIKTTRGKSIYQKGKKEIETRNDGKNNGSRRQKLNTKNKKNLKKKMKKNSILKEFLLKAQRGIWRYQKKVNIYLYMEVEGKIEYFFIKEFL